MRSTAKKAIRDIDIISKYCHPNDCEEEQLRVESLLTKTLLEINKENSMTINSSDLIKAKSHGDKKQEEDRIKKVLDELDELAEIQIRLSKIAGLEIVLLNVEYFVS